MPNPYFQFKQFTVHHDRCAMKVTTDACLFGAWVANELYQAAHAPALLLDIGTGTGLLSLMVAQKTTGQIDAVEIDPAAAQQARENIGSSAWKERIHVHQEDVLQWDAAKRYDCIFSNPPFYEKEIKSLASAKNIAHHDEGLKLAQLLSFINKQLTEEGIFFLLLPAKREKEAEMILHTSHLYLQQKVLVNQTPNHPPFRIMLQGSRKKGAALAPQTITLKNKAGDYTPAFVQLLHTYYLYLSMAS